MLISDTPRGKPSLHVVCCVSDRIPKLIIAGCSFNPLPAEKYAETCLLNACFGVVLMFSYSGDMRGVQMLRYAFRRNRSKFKRTSLVASHMHPRLTII